MAFRSNLNRSFAAKWRSLAIETRRCRNVKAARSLFGRRLCFGRTRGSYQGLRERTARLTVQILPAQCGSKSEITLADIDHIVRQDLARLVGAIVGAAPGHAEPILIGARRVATAQNHRIGHRHPRDESI